MPTHDSTDTDTDTVEPGTPVRDVLWSSLPDSDTATIPEKYRETLAAQYEDAGYFVAVKMAERRNPGRANNLADWLRTNDHHATKLRLLRLLVEYTYGVTYKTLEEELGVARRTVVHHVGNLRDLGVVETWSNPRQVAIVDDEIRLVAFDLVDV